MTRALKHEQNDVPETPDSPDGRKPRFVGLAMIGAFALIAVLLYSTRSTYLTATNALLALAIAGVGLTPLFWQALWPPATRRPFPFLELTGLFYSVFFGASAFLVVFLTPPFINFNLGVNVTNGIEFYGHIFIERLLPEAQWLVLIGVSAMIGAWLWARSRLPVGRMRIVSGAHSPGRFRLLLWGFALASLCYLYVPGLRTLPSIGQFLMPVGFLAFAGFWALFLRSESPRIEAAGYFLVVLPLWIAKLLATLFLTPALLVAVLAIAIWYWVRGTLPWKTGIVLVVAFLAYYPCQGKVRAVLWSNSPQYSAIEQIAAVGRILSDNLSSWENYRRGMEREFGFTGLARRFSAILPLSHVVEQTPAAVPYWQGETYRPLLTNLVPRAIWPEKPREVAGGAFGHRYGILKEADGSMSLNLPWVTELYANFGPWGVVLGMALVGILLGGLDRVLNSPTASPPEAAVGASLLLPLFYQESNFSLMMGSLLPLAVSVWLYFRLGLNIRRSEN